ncbi:cytochrome c oxidase assembly protein [Solirubrobacter phytolaccae]|uniref:Cytochrome c oxidase assembly protein n=1 Tax=Solirubrobacter phytolaccae TaxID=1404360 RepID=A0A9X3S7X7_9ACTN|nr:cytochrome c oxidase assembly protein [Solirubrobacter phytolaccae]MDA0181534.1 cytochrome c oxidase assembly protein [Solirubrobacter phytolaccae]
MPTLLGAAEPVDAGWNFAPIILIALIAYVWVYVARWRTSRREGGARAAGYGRLALWLLGIALLGVALISPVDRLGEQFATFHMVQHLILADLVPICLTVALTKHILRPVTRRIHWIEKKAGPFGHPAFGVIAYAAAMWIWHIPVMYEAALEHSFVHTLEHLSFAAAGALYWWHLLSPIRSRLRLGGLGPVLYMASTKIAVGFLGIMLGFAPNLLYDYYEHSGTRWGLSPIDDQHIAGVLMALEQSLVMGVALAYLFIRMLAESDEADEREERYGTV